MNFVSIKFGHWGIILSGPRFAQAISRAPKGSESCIWSKVPGRNESEE